jgi:hypothetical protein
VKRRLAALSLLVLVAAACASDRPDASRKVPTSSSSTLADLPGRPGTSGTAAPRSSTSLPPSTRGQPSTSTTAGAPGGLGTPGAPGADAALYLRPAPRPSLRVQVLIEPGAEPRQGTLDRVTSDLRRVSGKSVTVTGGALPESGGWEWTPAAIESSAAARSPSVPGDVAVLQVLFLGGRYAGDDGVLGISVNSRVFAVFSDQVERAATALVGPERIELAVTIHELGHLLGLVDLYLHTGRADPDHPGHSTNPRSVMYWAVESDVVADLLRGGPPVDFDAADLADLAVIRDG